jgi:isopenicillin N synthase-like dioxygenase
MHADLAKSLGVSLQTIDRIIAAVGSVGLFRIVREFKETMKSKKGSKKKVSSKMFDIKKWEKQQYKEWKPSDARRY